jgi:hypothetical protein
MFASNQQKPQEVMGCHSFSQLTMPRARCGGDAMVPATQETEGGRRDRI